MKLNSDEIQKELKSLPDWNLNAGRIEKEFRFSDFAAALAFVNNAASKAEDLNHHPDILLYGWNKVRITIYTHSEEGLTEADFILARAIG